MKSGPLGELLADAGAVVGGTAALGATFGFVAGSLVRDFRPTTDPDAWARRGALWAGSPAA